MLRTFAGAVFRAYCVSYLVEEEDSLSPAALNIISWGVAGRFASNILLGPPVLLIRTTFSRCCRILQVRYFVPTAWIPFRQNRSRVSPVTQCLKASRSRENGLCSMFQRKHSSPGKYVVAIVLFGDQPQLKLLHGYNLLTQWFLLGSLEVVPL